MGIQNPTKLLKSLLRLLYSILSPRTDRAKRERNTITTGTENHVIEVALYQSAELTKHRGRTPEQVFAKFVAMAIKDAGFDARVHYGFKPSFNLPREDNSVKSFNWWAKNSPKDALNSNLLLYDAKGGGRAAIGFKNGIVGMNRVGRTEEPRTPCDNDVCDNIWPGIHELGHNLGGSHSTPMMLDKPQIEFHPNMKELLHERSDDGEMPDWRDQQGD